MRKLLVCVLALAAGRLAVADSAWKEVSSVPHTGKTPKEVSALLAQYSDAFRSELITATAQTAAGLPVDMIVGATVTELTLKWTGPTQCTAEDPRLSVTVTNTTTSKASGEGSASTSMPAEGDPCSTK